MIHHNTIRTYTAALLDLFNDLEIQYNLGDGITKTKNVPVVYSTVEKIGQLDQKTLEQLLSGNTNILPRASLALSGVTKNPSNTLNKQLKTNTVKSSQEYAFSWNSVPYTFNYVLSIECRGMNELCSFIEQIGPMFNPTINIDVMDAQNLNEFTRIPVVLEDMDIASDEYNDGSMNIFTLNCSLRIQGSLYPPIRNIERIREYKILLNEEFSDNTYVRRDIMHWDVDESGKPINETITNTSPTRAPEIIDFVSVGNFGTNENKLILIFEDDSKQDEMKFKFEVIQGNDFVESMSNERNKLTLFISENCPNGTVIEIDAKVTDVYGNFSNLAKEFTINNSLLSD